MKTRLLWIAIAAVGLAALYFGLTKPHVSTIPQSIRQPLADLKPTLPMPELPTPVIPPLPTIAPPPLVVRPMPPPQVTPRGDPVLPPQEVPIQNAATIDFSTGAPVIRSQGKDQEALERAVKEMAEATKNTKFEPTK